MRVVSAVTIVAYKKTVLALLRTELALECPYLQGLCVQRSLSLRNIEIPISMHLLLRFLTIVYRHATPAARSQSDLTAGLAVAGRFENNLERYEISKGSAWSNLPGTLIRTAIRLPQEREKF